MRFENVAKDAEKLLDHVRGFYEDMPNGYTLSEDSYARAVNVIGRFSSVDKYTLFQSAHGFIGMPLCRETFYELCYAVAANKKELKDKEVVPFRSKLVRDGIYTVRFHDVKYIEDDKLVIHVMALTGSLAHRMISLRPPLSRAYGWLKLIGYNSKPGDPCAFAPISAAFPGLYGNMQIITTHNQPEPPDRVKIDIVSQAKKTKYGVGTDVLAKHNQKIIKIRSGIGECPFQLEEERAKHRNFCSLYCPVGWDKCEACGHKDVYTISMCPDCNSEFYFAPGGERCLRCQRDKDGFSEFD